MKVLPKTFALAFFWLAISTSSGFAKDVILPLTLDHRLLTSLLLYNSFSGSEQRAAIVGTPGDCTYISLSKPQFSSADNFLRLELRLDVQVSKQLGETCLVPLQWHGYLELLQQPVLDIHTFELSFRTVHSNLFTLSRKPATIAGLVWEFARPRVHEYLDQVRIDLAPPVSELRSFLPSLFQESTARAVLDSLRGREVFVAEDAVIIELLAEVNQTFEPEDGEPGKELTGEERDKLIKLWDTWDAFLVQLLKTIATDSLSPEDRQILIDVLLDTRYSFATALLKPSLKKDFVREQFVHAWKLLSPVFRRQLYSQPSEKNFGYLAFFTAVNGLAVFDRLGPSFGVEISERGLLRLAGILEGKETSLPYEQQLDKQLRELLQLPTSENDLDPPFNYEEIDIPENTLESDPFSQLFNFLSKPLYAAEVPDFSEILRWKVPGKNISEYLTRVRAVLTESCGTFLLTADIPDQFHGMFKELIPAMAWQESCFRQFVVKNKKLTYLLSYNQTSVGLMQINERVWRGVYDRSRLRWDIHYNALAGCEIAGLYLRKYALKHSMWEKRGDTKLLAQVVYAMYNGGPSQYQKFMNRESTGKLYQSDQLFLEKLQWVKKKKWEFITKCLVGS